MAKKLIKLKRRKALLLIPCILILISLYLFSPVLVGNVSTGQLKKVFAQQSEIFTEPIASLGVTGQPTTNFQCIDELHTHWQTSLICQDFYIYPDNQSPISLTAKNNYAINAAKFDKLLKQNGWVNDRPHDPITTLAGSNPYLPQNNGLGDGVPFHKNIGSISCNLEIDFSSLSELVGPGSININGFGCSQTIKFPMPHLINWQSPGP